MNKIKSVLEFLKEFGKFVFTTMTGKVFMWGSVILLGVSKLIMVLMDLAFAEDCRKEEAKTSINTDTEE